jgi:hypothetical protein
MNDDLKMSFQAIGKELNRVKKALVSLRNSQIAAENELGVANSRISSMSEEIEALKNSINVPRLIRSGALQGLNNFTLHLPDTNNCLVMLEDLKIAANDTLKIRSILNDKTLETHGDYLAKGGAPINHYGSMSLIANAKYSVSFKLLNCNDVLHGECHTEDMSEYPSFSYKTDKVWMVKKNKITKVSISLDTTQNIIIDGRWAVYSI